MKRILLAVSVFAVIWFTSCTEQTRAKSFGGNMTINLQPNQKLVNATWKNSDLWYLTEQGDSNFKPKRYTFQESSTFGMMEGTVTFIESK
jgi:hypothetical protein